MIKSSNVELRAKNVWWESFFRLITSRCCWIKRAIRRWRVDVRHLRRLANEDLPHGWNQLSMRAGLSCDRWCRHCFLGYFAVASTCKLNLELISTWDCAMAQRCSESLKTRSEFVFTKAVEWLEVINSFAQWLLSSCDDFYLHFYFA